MKENDGWWRRIFRYLVSTRSGSVIILLAGIAIGWWAGSFTACAGKGCEVRVDSIEALGTWVGGVGTIAALYWAGASHRQREEERREAEARAKLTAQEQQDLYESEAEEVVLSVHFGGGTAMIADLVRFRVKNNAIKTPIYKVVCVVEGWPRVAEVREIGPGALGEFEYKTSNAKGKLPAPVAAPMRVKWQDDLLAIMTVTWTMNGIRWTRTANGPVKRVQ